MKKLFFLGLLSIGFALNSNAQEVSDNALGLRLGDSDGFGAEISYQRALGRNMNRLEFDLGWRDNNNFDAFKLTGLYQWVMPIEGRFNWYVGAGGGIGSVDFNDDRFDDDNDGAFIFAAGDVGIEYNFDIPLLLSLDFRPELGLVGYDGFDDDFDFDIALGIRYQF
ncbi:hypothetical protein [Zhouia amylolytica]|uniref:Secreted protein n=1 Tax=Zhouia amylolytica AD3 TaxID=1286632 RepID=W2UPM4_9FLAO|nr:hypothetical protein [Zhouia amylolytica]ETN95441.1 hypothetical protein P278_11630 [Zhouia amylolytica AD3]MCQ0112709.1 hypothetical protein [Zhouia amylolytica]